MVCKATTCRSGVLHCILLFISCRCCCKCSAMLGCGTTACTVASPAEAALLLQAAVDIEMHGLAYIEHSSAVPGSELAVSGRLELQQLSLLKAGTRRQVYNSPILFSVNTTDPFLLVRMLGRPYCY
jgi:hypothetical protein